MRLLTPLCLALGLLTGHANAASEPATKEVSYLDTSLYCSGKDILNSVLMFRTDMNNAESIASLEDIWNVSCKRLSKAVLWFVDVFAFGIKEGEKKSRMIMYEFRDDNKAVWYRWEYK